MKQKYRMNLDAFNGDHCEKMIEMRMKELNYTRMEEYYIEIEYNHEEALHLKNSFFVTYTDFFRDRRLFLTLEKIVLPKLIKEKSADDEIRIWSVGCSTGQEPYSIAMTIEEYFHHSGHRMNYRIFASDQGQDLLKQAKEGSFLISDLSNVVLGMLSKYFVLHNNHYVVIDEIKKHILFVHHHLLEDKSYCPRESIYGGFDLIFCNNMLYYYNLKTQKKMMNLLEQSLNSTGFIFTGETEKYALTANNKFKVVEVNSTVFRKKISSISGGNM